MLGGESFDFIKGEMVKVSPVWSTSEFCADFGLYRKFVEIVSYKGHPKNGQEMFSRGRVR